MKKLLALSLALMLTLALFTGCDPSSVTDGTTASSGSATTTGGGGDTTTGASGGGRSDIVIAIPSDISTLHPSDYATSSEGAVNRQIYDSLMYTQEGELYPRLAERWEVGSDGLSYTFYLRQDVTFHDGSPFTAEDVKFSAELFQASAYQGAVVDGLAEVEIVDAHTVILRTETLFSPFLENIASMNIASKSHYDAVDADTFASKPVGCGPYMFVSHDLGSKVTLSAYDSYYRGAPTIKDVTFRVLTDDATIAMSLQAGELDYVEISEANFANLEGKAGIVIQEVPASRFGFISLNHERYPYSEVKFRQAVAYAIDRQNLIDLALDGIGTVNSNLISPLRFGWSASQPEYTYDPDKAIALLDELGIERPYDLGVMPVSEAFKTQGEVIQNDLAKVGLTVTLEIQEQNALLGSMFNGDIGITTMAMSLEGVTQSYAMALTTPYVGMANNVRYANPEIDDLFQQAVEAIDEDARFEIYNEIFTRVQNEAVFVVLYNSVVLSAYSDQLNVPTLPLEGAYYIYDLSWK